MVDHWKALANRLGTPGIDDPTPSEPSTPPAENVVAPPPQPPEPKAKPAAVETPEKLPEKLPEELPEAAIIPPASAEPEKSDAPTKKRRSSWETLANLFNVSVPRETPPAAEEVAPEPAPARPAAEPAAEKRRSPTPTRETAASSEEDLKDIFKPKPAAGSSPLDEMFEAPQDSLKLEGWGKPKRVIDDVSWDEPLDVADLDDEEASQSPTRTAAAADDEPEEPRRRRRRRGRRGRSRDDSVAEKQTEEDFDSDDVPARLSTPVSWEVDTLEVESAGAWEEPETFESDDFEPASNKMDDLEEDEESGEVLRRSSRRRRRRGRGRDDDSVTDAPRAERSERPGRDLPPTRSPSSERQRPPRGPRTSDAPPVEKVVIRKSYEDDDFLETVDEELSPRDEVRERPSRERPTREPREGREPRESREPREPREGEVRRRRSRKPAEVASRTASNPDLEADFDDEDDGEEALEAKQHRNIPTWNDALEAIIAANTENHKRNEGRGGGRFGGRSRGRR